MNLRKIATRLQIALNQQGKILKINQCQTYSEKYKKIITKFVLKEKNKTILETYQLSEIVKKLAEIYGGDAE